jgi:acylphosphatase
MSEVAAVEVLIRGRVQGVFFRGWTEEQAVARGLSGWVRNNTDGTVSALFVGPCIVVDEMLRACREGPRAARVAAVETSPVHPPPENAPERRGFRILR